MSERTGGLAVNSTIGSARYNNIDSLLDAIHEAAASSNLNAYFACFDKNARYIGSDSKENWSINEFLQFSQPKFERCLGWVYKTVPESRHLNFYPSESSPLLCTFDELLRSETFEALCRGTGTAILNSCTGCWLILQYHISFPIPNEIVRSICSKVSVHEIEKASSDVEQEIMDMLGQIEVEKTILQQQVSSLTPIVGNVQAGRGSKAIGSTSSRVEGGRGRWGDRK